MEFSTNTFDAAANSGRNMSSNKSAHIGVQNSSYGYFGGGYDFPPTVSYTTVDRLDFSTESYSLSANLTTPNSIGLMQGKGFQNELYGYFGGGYTFPPTLTHRCNVYRLDFSNDTMSSGGNLTSNFSRSSAMSGLYDAWWMFGSDALSGSRRSRYNYSTDTASHLPALTPGSSDANGVEFEN